MKPRRRPVRRAPLGLLPAPEYLEVRRLLTSYTYGITTSTEIIYRPSATTSGSLGAVKITMDPQNISFSDVSLLITTSPDYKRHTFDVYVGSVSPGNLLTGEYEIIRNNPKNLIIVPKAEPTGETENYGEVLVTLLIGNPYYDSPGHTFTYSPNSTQVLIKNWPATEPDPGPDPVPAPSPVVPVPQAEGLSFGFCGPLKPQAETTSTAGLAAAATTITAGGIMGFNGAPSVDPLTLYSGGFGKEWGLATDWTSTFAYSDGGTVGRGFVNLFQPTLQQANGGGLRVVKSASDVQWFSPDDSDGYKASFYGREKLAYDPSTGDYVLTDVDGGVTRFYGFGSTVPTLQKGRFKSYADPYSPDGDDPSHRITTVYDANGRMISQQRGDSSATETYNYYYLPSGVNAGLLDYATLSRTVGGATTIVRQAKFEYYDGSNTGQQVGGNAGDLKLEKILDATGSVVLDATYFRYYTSDGPTGFADGLKYVFHYDAYARLDAAIGDELAATDEAIKNYADAFYEYDADRRVTKAVLQGAGCSCSTSSGAGEYTYSYHTSPFAGVAGGDFNTWRSKTVETLPDGNQYVYYYNFAGELMLQAFSVISDGTGSSLAGGVWATSYRYDSAGRLIQAAQPSAVAITTPSTLAAAESNSDLVGYGVNTGAYQYLRPSTGLIYVYGYGESTTAGSTTAGDVAGYLKDVWIKNGYDAGGPTRLASYGYKGNTAAGATIYVLGAETAYNGSSVLTTSYDYAWLAGTNHVTSMTVKHPAVAAAQNGSNATESETYYFDEYGRQTWAVDAGGFLRYTGYDPKGSGAVVREIFDVDTTRADLYSGVAPIATQSGGGLNLVYTYEVDALGRVVGYTDPSNRVTRWVYNDAAREVRTYRGWNAADGTTTGPIEITRVDFAGNFVETLTIAVSPGHAGSANSLVPTGGETFGIGDVRSLVRTLYDLGGRVVEEDAYYNFSGAAYAKSTPIGAVGTNYYATKYGYDHRGRLSRVVDAVGTITATAYDALGRVVTTSIGTADGFGGTGPSNMSVVARYEYDGGGGAVGDGNLTRATYYPAGESASSDTYRVARYAYDWRNRLISFKVGAFGVEGDAVQSRLYYFDVDNLDRVVAVSDYDGDGIAPSTTRPSAALLRAYATYAYDDQGRAYEQRIYHVDPVNGGAPDVNSTNYLRTSTFYDARGHAVANYAPGGLASKARYDGAGRLAWAATSDGGGDSGWDSADDLVGDRVLTETRIRYNPAGDPILTTVLDRNHDSAATGPLYAPGTDGPDDAGFESYNVAAGAFNYAPSGTPWTFQGGSGISGNGSGFTSGNRNAPQGGRVAFLQGDSAISQTRDHWEAGSYTITFRAAQRANVSSAQSILLKVDGITVDSFSPSGAAYETFFKTVSLTAGRHTIAFVGASSGDDTAFIDDVTITAGTAPVLQDPGFENGAPGQPSPNWVAAGSAGVVDRTSAFFTGAPVPASLQGDRVLYLQNTGSASQELYLAAGTYTVFFRAVQRQNVANQNQVLQVTYTPAGGAETLAGTYKPSGSDFQALSATITAATAGNYTIRFRGTAPAGGDVTAFVDAVSIAPTSARASYAAYYYDLAHRLVQAVDVGTNGGRSYYRSGAGVARSDTALVTDYHYDDAGRLDQVSDPRGAYTRMSYDALGRPTEVVANAPALPSPVGAVTSSANNTTRYTYDGLGRPVTVTAVMPSAASNQVTTYNYGVSPAYGSSVYSNGALRSIVQPDGATTSYAYNALGQVVKATDPNGTVHEYSYDVLGRFRSDSATTLGAGVDGAIRRLETAYDSAGRAYLFTSYDASSGGNVVNQVMDVFNGYGQLLAEYQSHSGAVSGSSLQIQYAYSTPSPTANYSRLVSKTYPNGRVLGYSYASGLDSAVSRVSAITEGTASGAPALESYAYLGLGTIVEKAQPGGGVKLTYLRQAGDVAARGDGGDRYTGLDRFGRVIDQNWIRTAASADGGAVGSSTVRLQYGYDRVGNAVYRRDLVNAALSELYQYDQLDRLVSMKRGVLDASNAIASPTFQQSWDLDARGNQLGVATVDGSTTSSVANQFNEANETTSTTGGATPAYDAAGNTTSRGVRDYIYDAWNRLKSVKDGGTTIAAYAYDALRRRIVEVSGGQVAHVYFDGGTKAMEDRVGGAGFAYQYVTGLTGEVVVRDVYSNVAGAGNPEWRTFAQTDANGNVVALIGAGSAFGVVVERYAYAPYGVVTILEGSGVVRTTPSPYQWKYLYQGGVLDAATGLYEFGFRDYDPASGVWMQRDPIGLAGGDLNLYRFVANNPVVYVDPSGLEGQTWWDAAYDWYQSSPTASAAGGFAYGGINAALDYAGTGAAFVDGTLGGLVNSVIDPILEPVLGPMQPFEPLNDHTTAWSYGRTTGQSIGTLGGLLSSAGGFFTAGMGLASLVEGSGLIVTGGSVLTLPLTAPVAAVGGVAVGGIGLYMACSNLGRPNGNPPTPGPRSTSPRTFPPNSITPGEAAEIQAIADKYKTTIDIVGSRAAGKGRNVNTNLPKGKSPKTTRSDIDFRIDSMHPQVDALINELKKVGGGIGTAARKYSNNAKAPGGRETKPPFIRFTPGT